MTIDKIDIMENEIFISIYPKINEMEIEGKIYPIDDETIENLLRILRTWDNEYINNLSEPSDADGKNEEIYECVCSLKDSYKTIIIL